MPHKTSRNSKLGDISFGKSFSYCFYDKIVSRKSLFLQARFKFLMKFEKNKFLKDTADRSRLLIFQTQSLSFSPKMHWYGHLDRRRF